VKVGLVIPNRGPEAFDNVRELPAWAESLGFSTMWFSDHVVGVESYAPLYGPEWAECLTSLAYAAASTRDIGLGLGILVVPYRDPVLQARMLATIDALSGGRLILGVGIGWSRSEFRALGRGDLYEDRSRYTDEALEVMQRCWEGGAPFGWDGEWVRFRRIESEPPPAQRPRPPLWVGGQTAPALRRAARWADVWHPTRLEPDQFGDLGDQLDELKGHPVPRSMRLRVFPGTTPEELMETLAEYEAARCEEIAVEYHVTDPAELRPWAERLAKVAVG
jgi:probable F420-dependent oxidoreductase